MPIMVSKDRRTRIIRARVVPQKGSHWYGIQVFSGVVESLGHPEVILKSVQEPSLISLKDAVRAELRINLVMEDPPEYESRSTGGVERATQMIRGQFRTIKDISESRYCQRIGGERPCVPWLLAHASDIATRYHVYKDGKAAYENWKGRKLKGSYREFRDNVLYVRPGSKARISLKLGGRKVFGMGWPTGPGRR